MTLLYVTTNPCKDFKQANPWWEKWGESTIFLFPCQQWGPISTFLHLPELSSLATGRTPSEMHACPDRIRGTRKEISWSLCLIVQVDITFRLSRWQPLTYPSYGLCQHRILPVYTWEIMRKKGWWLDFHKPGDRYQWPLKMWLWSLPRRSGWCLILVREEFAEMWYWKTIWVLPQWNINYGSLLWSPHWLKKR